MKLTYWAITHQGRRADNQDGLGLIDAIASVEAKVLSAASSITTTAQILAVADGVGGRPEGRWAAHTVLNSLLESNIETNTIEQVEQRIIAAHAELAERKAHGSGPATTLAGLSVTTDRIVLFHLGDSRIYRLDRRETQRLTTDHRSRTDGRSITRFLGGSLAQALPTMGEASLEHGAMYLVTTDGFHGFLRPLDLLLLCDLDPHQALATLVDTALENGSDDNLSAIVVRIEL